jgi:glutamate dehydrogenase (NADP+)
VSAQTEIDRFMTGLEASNPSEREFHQAVREVVQSVMPLVMDREDYQRANILERLTEPDRIVIFRVTWEDDAGNVRVNRAWRVQFNNAIGPYKGGLRFHPSVNQSVLKFLGFEQVFKNSLTGLPMGGAKGGANFDPKGKSDREVMRFCQSLMVELHRHIGEDTDIPAGDIGVGAREISYLFGMYKRLSNRFVGTLTGKGLAFGGSLVRREATGYGAVYFLKSMLAERGESLRDKTAVVSGSGNVALYAVEKLVEEGAVVLTVSDSKGVLYDPDGIDPDKLSFLKELKEVRRERLDRYVERYPKARFEEAGRPWSVPAQLAVPCATQNELDSEDAARLVDNGVIAVVEGANMPSTHDAVERFRRAGVLFGPGKAANAGGVAVSGLEQSQNALRISWSRDEVDQRLRGIMSNIHARCLEHGRSADGTVDYVDGANRAGFLKVAEALVAYGAV